MSTAAVIGAGAWGTALADLLTFGGHRTTLWAHESDVADQVNREHRNDRFLADVPLNPALRATDDQQEALAGADLVLYAAPSHVLRAVARAGAAHVPARATCAVATKGIEEDTLALMTDVIAAEVPGRPVVAVSGPSFALEVARGQPTAVVAACDDHGAAVAVQGILSGPAFRVYTTDDVTGVELGGALKNVMAIAVGIAEGLGLGHNPRAALITRGLAEIARLGVSLGARTETFLGLAGLGDLVLTCTGPLSRNHAVGVELGQGRSLAEILRGRETVAEGVRNARSARALARRHGVEMPIVDAVHGVLFDGAAPQGFLTSLMARELRREHD